MPELPDPSRAWEDLSAADRRALTEMLVDKIIIERHPSKIDKDGRRHYLIRAIPYQDPQQEAERLKKPSLGRHSGTLAHRGETSPEASAACRAFLRGRRYGAARREH